MTLFAPGPGPRVFALPPGADFTAALIEGLDARLAGAPPETMARIEIWVNTQRARRALTEAFANGPARLLPRIRALSELAEDLRLPLELPPAGPALARKLELARLVAALLAAEPGRAAETAVFDLADSLAQLLDDLEGEGIDPAALRRIDAGDHAAHWQQSLRFLDILVTHAAATIPGGQGRLRRVAEALAAAWATNAPADPVLVAGSTGSRGGTRAFMAAVARLPQGALILPGHDPALPEAVWRRLGAGEAGAFDHPQHGFRRLADSLGFDAGAVTSWHPVAPPAPERNALVSLALRPAPVTDQWRQEGRGLAGSLAAATDGLAWIDAPDARAEGRAIALALRDAAAEGLRAALVTPDRTLARRVTAELDRWGIIPDDSAGRPLGLVPPGVLLRHLAGLAGEPLAPATLLALLKHPLVASAPGARAGHAALTARLELERLRGGPPVVDWPALRDWAAEGPEQAAPWIAWLEGALRPLATAGPRPLAAHVAAQVAAAESLAAGHQAGGEHGLWAKEAGARARALMESLAAAGEAFGPTSPAQYRALLQSEMAARDVPEEAVVTDAGIAIWGTLEARVQSADLVILGALNEGIWPRIPGADPWLNRGLRLAIGLPSPEQSVGLAAHDFQQAITAPRAIVSRAARDAEAPTVPSRWLLRLENLLLGLGEEGRDALAAARRRGDVLLARAADLDRPAAPLAPARRPSPRPPAAARPDALSVTQVETLVRDPYAIYARKVLDLVALDPPGRAADALARGSALHDALDAFVAATEAGLPPDAAAVFAETLRESLARNAPWPAVRAIWTARLDRVAAWFLAGEEERRARARPLAREVRGRLALAGLAWPFAVTAKADRIDRAGDGRFAIYDYKSGGLPSRAEADAFHLQLPLEAAILAAGGFEDLSVGPVSHLELIGLGSRKTLSLDADPAAISETLDRLRQLIATYQNPATGFTARLRPQRLSYASDYDHLSRHGEWSDGDATEDSP
ncbi:MAG: double-strand break repair protein AddB [Rhodobacteraceae bacterium]|nr:double-strand break repair protein AddB [Paracoccaceae bacterium]